MLSDPHGFVRSAAAGALGKHDEKLSRSVEALLLSLSDASSLVRYMAADALRNYDGGDTHATHALLYTLSDSEWNVRGAAAFALATAHNDVEAIGVNIEILLLTVCPDCSARSDRLQPHFQRAP